MVLKSNLNTVGSSNFQNIEALYLVCILKENLPVMKALLTLHIPFRSILVKVEQVFRGRIIIAKPPRILVLCFWVT